MPIAKRRAKAGYLTVRYHQDLIYCEVLGKVLRYDRSSLVVRSKVKKYRYR